MGVKPTNIGGQAVIEGVMMRGPSHLATAVRQPDGEITIDRQPLKTAGDRWPVLKKPLIRGVVALVESLVYGMKALSFSARVAGDEEEELTDREIILTMGGAFLLAILLFIVLPIIGLVMMYNRGNPWIAFGIVMPHAAEANFDLVDMLKSWHVTLANLGYFVIALHAVAALMHHYFWKDNTLLRMMPRKRS